MAQLRIFFCSLSLLPLITHAAMVPPEFSGKWRDDKDVTYLGTDACSTNQYSYKKTISGTAKDAAEALILIDEKNNCSWQKAEFIEKVPSGLMPIDFPGDISDWEKIAESSNNPITQTWSKACIDKAGTVIDKRQITLSPIYACPLGSRFGLSADENSVGCSTTPDTCAADVVGRDLKYPVVSWVGHVGMTMPGWGILEVLNDPEVIHSDHSFDDFSHPSDGYSYWGNAYDLPEKSSLTENQAMNILKAGFDQQEFSPEYTFSSTWTAGSKVDLLTFNPESQRLEHINSIQHAVFRCDTFVDYAYLAGAGIYILSPSQFVFPRTTYDQFIHQRFISTAPFNTSSTESKKHPAVSNSKQLEIVFSYPELDLALAEQVIKNINTDASFSRMQKLQIFWTTALKLQGEPIKFGYLIDTLQFMNPTELENSFMALYQTSSNEGNKIKLLSAIWQGATLSPNSSLSTEEQTNTLKQMQFFLSNQLQQETDPVLLKELIYVYSAITPGKSANQLIKEKIQQIQKEQKQNMRSSEKPILPDVEGFRIQIRQALMTKESAQQIFPELFNQNKDNPDFSMALCQVAPQDASTLNPTSQTMIKTYLNHRAALKAKPKTYMERLSRC